MDPLADTRLQTDNHTVQIRIDHDFMDCNVYAYLGLSDVLF